MKAKLADTPPMVGSVSMLMKGNPAADKRVNMVTPALFARYPDARSLADADAAELEEIIKSTGFFRAKAKSLIGMAQDGLAAFEPYGRCDRGRTSADCRGGR